MLRKKNGGLDIIEERPKNAIKQANIYTDDVDMIGNYETDIKKKIKRPDEEGEQLVDLADNPFPEDADSESFIKDDEEEGEKERQKKPRVHSESEDD